MKRIITLSLAIIIAFAASAQKNITTFMGIPIDGTKSEMIEKLKAKGFTYNANKDVLSGEFNGRNVRLYIVTNNNKVYRIMVVDAEGSSEKNIKIRFNKLCNQFIDNGKYIQQNPFADYTIDDDADIYYEMMVNKKRFQASYFQMSKADNDTTGLKDWALDRIEKEYSREELESMDEKERLSVMLSLGMMYIIEKVQHKSVWFMIDHDLGSYFIYIFYDNELNAAHGEDL